MPVADKSRGRKFVDKLGRYNQIAKAQAGKQHLAEAAGEHHRATGGVQPLKRGNRPPGVAIFAVIVVLKDQCPDSSGHAEEIEPAIDAHRDSKWELVRRRSVYEFW